MGFGGIHGHARFALHMLAGFEGGTGHFAVHVGPGTDHHGINVVVSEEFPPVFEDGRDAERIGDALGRFSATVAHADDFHSRYGLQARDMPRPRIAAGANDANLDGLFTHAASSPLSHR